VHSLVLVSLSTRALVLTLCFLSIFRQPLARLAGTFPCEYPTGGYYAEYDDDDVFGPQREFLSIDLRSVDMGIALFMFLASYAHLHLVCTQTLYSLPHDV
jgi:hypothetical protein